MYYRVRAEGAPTNRFARAARFIYLNRACWNGLYRENSLGQFNVPFGSPKTDSGLDEDNLLACATLLRRAAIQLKVGDFLTNLSEVHKGDLVFLDPPYVTQHNNNGFVEYNRRLFCWSDQIRLANLAEALRARGVHVVVTNAAHSDILRLYPNFFYFEFERSSTLAASAVKRGRVNEAIFFSED